MNNLFKSKMQKLLKINLAKKKVKILAGPENDRTL